MTCTSERGFGLVELLVSIAIVLVVIAAVFELMDPVHGVFDMELERVDMQQRGRVSIDAMFKDLVMAGAGLQIPPVAPFRRGQINADPAGTAFRDRISVQYVPADATPEAVVTATYWTRVDADGIPTLMRYDGRTSDLPVADLVSVAGFDYFDATSQRIDLGRFTDGPWLPDGASPNRFDADLLAIRRVRVRLLVRAERTFLRGPLQDHHVSVDVAPRNLNLP